MGVRPNWGRGIGMGLSSLGQSMMQNEQRKRQEEQRAAEIARIDRMRQEDIALKYPFSVTAPGQDFANTMPGAPFGGLPGAAGPLADAMVPPSGAFSTPSQTARVSPSEYRQWNKPEPEAVEPDAPDPLFSGPFGQPMDHYPTEEEMAEFRRQGYGWSGTKWETVDQADPKGLTPNAAAKVQQQTIDDLANAMMGSVLETSTAQSGWGTGVFSPQAFIDTGADIGGESGYYKADLMKPVIHEFKQLMGQLDEAGNPIMSPDQAASDAMMATYDRFPELFPTTEEDYVEDLGVGMDGFDPTRGFKEEKWQPGDNWTSVDDAKVIFSKMIEESANPELTFGSLVNALTQSVKDGGPGLTKDQAVSIIGELDGEDLSTVADIQPNEPAGAREAFRSAYGEPEAFRTNRSGIPQYLFQGTWYDVGGSQ